MPLDVTAASPPLVEQEAACRGRLRSERLSLRIRNAPRASVTSYSNRAVPLADAARAALRVCQSTMPPTLHTLARQRHVICRLDQADELRARELGLGSVRMAGRECSDRHRIVALPDLAPFLRQPPLRLDATGLCGTRGAGRALGFRGGLLVEGVECGG